MGLFPAWDRIANRTGGGGGGVLRTASLTETYEYHIHFFIDIRDGFAAERTILIFFIVTEALFVLGLVSTLERVQTQSHLFK